VKLFKRITRDWHIKLLSLALASFLWMYVRSLQEEERTYHLPLVLQNAHPEYIVSSDVPDTVKVVFKGMEENLSRLDEREMHAYVDLNRSTRETLKRVVKLGDNDIPRGITVREIAPRWLDLTQEKAGTREVVITPVIGGEPPYGFSLQNVSVDPKEVVIRGPLSLISAVESVFTEEIDVSEMRESTVVRADLETGRKTVQVVDREAVDVQITIEEDFIIKRIELSLRARNLGEDLVLGAPEEIVTALVKVPKRMERSFKEKQVYAVVDCSGVREPGVYDLPLTFESENDSVVLMRMEPEALRIVIEPREEGAPGSTGRAIGDSGGAAT
jgi:YbbR domain-containing protein